MLLQDGIEPLNYYWDKEHMIKVLICGQLLV